MTRRFPALAALVLAVLALALPASVQASTLSRNVAADNLALQVASCSNATVFTGYSTDGVTPMRAVISWDGGSRSYTGTGVVKSGRVGVRGGGPGWQHTFRGLNLNGARSVSVSFYSQEYPSYPYLLSRATFKISDCSSRPVSVRLAGGVGAPTPTVKVVSYPVITGDPVVGSTLAVSPGTYSPTPQELSYTWIRVDDDGLYQDVGTGAQYTLTSADSGHELLASVRAFVPGMAPGWSFTKDSVLVP